MTGPSSFAVFLSDEERQRYYHIFNPFSQAEETLVSVFGTITASLSIFGALSILYIILAKKKFFCPGLVFHRIMGCMSVADMLSSLGFLLQPYLLPAAETQRPSAIGNFTTCETAAFLSYLAMASHMYSCFLSIYFLLKMRYDWSLIRISRALEPWIHLWAWGVPIILASVGVAFDVFNPRPVIGACLAGRYPVDCEVNEDVECQRGGSAGSVVLMVYIGLSFIAGMVGFVSTWIVYRSARRQPDRNERRIGAPSSSNSSPSRTTVASSDANNTLRRRKAIAGQAVWYTVAFINPFLLILFGSLLINSWTDTLEKLNNLHNQGPVVYLTYFFTDIVYTIQGFVNWLIFIRPSLARWRDSNPDKSFWWSLRQVLAARATPITLVTRHLAVPNNNDTSRTMSTEVQQSHEEVSP